MVPLLGAGHWRRDHQIPVLDHKTGHRDVGQVEREAGPLGSVVEGDVDAVLRTGVEQAFSVRVLAHHPHEVVTANAVDDLGPALSIVVGPPGIGSTVVHLIADAGHVGGARAVRRSFDERDAGVLRHVGGGDVVPLGTVAPRYVNEPVVRAGPDGRPVMG